MIWLRVFYGLMWLRGFFGLMWLRGFYGRRGRRSRRTPTLFDVGKLPNGGQVVGGRLQDILELGGRFVVPRHLQEGAAERDTGREIRGVLRQTGPADANGVFELAGPPMLLRELRKSNRRRILLNPASKFFNPRVVRHGLMVRPKASSWWPSDPGCRSPST